MAEDRALLSVRQLKTHFFTDEGVVKAVDDVSFSIGPGETVGIVGESGSGKSVTSLSIMRLVKSPPGKIVGGQILFRANEQEEAVDLLSLSEKDMRSHRGKDIAMIFQEPMTSLNPVFRCGDQVIEAIELHLKLSTADAKKRCLELFEKVQLPDPERIYRSYPHQLSGGQKQRVMIAMAMSCDPKLLIADEPTTALDVTVQKQILHLMNQLKREMKASVMFITHDLGVIAEIADRVIVMYKGKIVEQGSVYELFSNPRHPYTKGLLACRPPLDLRLSRLPVVADFMESREGPDGQLEIVEKEQTSLDEALAAHRISPEMRKARFDDLYAREALLEINDLKTWFPSRKNFFGKPLEYVKAVDGVSFKVYPGETLGLVGESGCGKTTLGRSILQLEKARSGSVLYKGKDLLPLSEREMKAYRRELQIIFQDPYSSLNPRMTIGQAIAEPLLVHRLYPDPKKREARVDELLELVSLSPQYKGRYPHEFSGGQRQRVCIARALALEPKFIVCDESVSALDVSVQAQVLNLLIQLRESLQLTYVFISHDLSVVKLMSDRMIVMNKGKMEEYDDADVIYASPKTEYTRKLINAIPKGRLEDIQRRLNLG
ncbi:MAG: ABC transporter ATP-binding protein [Bacteroidota bacterium]